MITPKIQEILPILQNAEFEIENAVQEAKWLEKYGKGDLTKLARRRASGEPLQYILGEWEFYGYPFKVGKGVLIPRPETELLVDLAKEYCVRNSVVFDLCAGSGCVGIALAKETGCKVIAVEKSSEAIEYLKQNIILNKVEKQVEIVQGDVLDLEVYQSLCAMNADWILINPPYLSKSEMQELQKEVTHEPESALFGGYDGLEFYRKFFKEWGWLADGNNFATEVGDGQAEAVCEMMREIGVNPLIKKDYNGIDRVVYSIQN